MIRQLSFEKGEAMGIRECTKVPPSDTSVEKLHELNANSDVLIVKSGKSYYDVTGKPEIFNEAEMFDLDSLTSIEARDLRQSEITKRLFGNSSQSNEDSDPLNMLYKNTSVEEEEESEEIFDRKTHYFRQNQIVALNQLCVLEGLDISEMMRELVDIGLAAKSEKYDRDFLAEANLVLQNSPRRAKKRRRKNTTTI